MPFTKSAGSRIRPHWFPVTVALLLETRTIRNQDTKMKVIMLVHHIIAIAIMVILVMHEISSMPSAMDGQ